MKLRRDVPALAQPPAHPVDQGIVLGMDHGQRTGLARDLEHIQKLFVRKRDAIGQEDLERRHAPVEGCQQLFAKPGDRGVGDDQVIRIIQHADRGTIIICLQHIVDRLTGSLRRKRDDCRVSTKGRAD